MRERSAPQLTLGMPENEIVLSPVSRMICSHRRQHILSEQSIEHRLTPAYSTLFFARSLASHRSCAKEYKAQSVSGEFSVTRAALCSDAA